MEYRSPSTRVKDIDTQIRRTLRKLDLAKQDREVREAITNLYQNLYDARSYTLDYELSETREEQLNNAKKSKRYMTKASKEVLQISQQGIFSPADVAHLSALIDQTKADLK